MTSEYLSYAVAKNCCIVINSEDKLLKKIPCSNDTEAMITEIRHALSRHNLHLLIIEGFKVLNYKPVAEKCHLKIYIDLDKKTVEKRRTLRVYNPPDTPGYFEKIVWPAYEKDKAYVMAHVNNVTYLDGGHSIEGLQNRVLVYLHEFLRVI